MSLNSAGGRFQDPVGFWPETSVPPLPPSLSLQRLTKWQLASHRTRAETKKEGEVVVL